MIKIATSFCLAILVLVFASSAFGATYVVTKTADTNDGVCDSDCSLREAIAVANGSVSNDVIVFALPLFSSTQTITLTNGELVVANNGSLTILGTGANRLTISGNNASRILVSGANVVVNIASLRFTAGNGVGTTNSGRGGAIYNVGGTMVIANSILTGNSAANGGALNNAASASPSVPANLTIDNCIISNNSSTSSGAAMQNFSTSTLHIRNTTVNNNTTSATGIAGAFQANGTVTITNSTFSGNSAPTGTGGGVYFNGTSLVMTNTTLANNSSGVGGGGLHRTGTATTANVRNTIIADNNGAAGTVDVSGAITSQGNNVIEAVGTSTGWIMTDQQNVDPQLLPLGFYGGFGMTHLPVSGSPAINGGDNCVLNASCAAANPPFALTVDERGAGRLFGANVDVGAVESSGEYYATFPSALAATPYTFTVVPANSGYTYSLNSGSFGGLNLDSTTTTTLSGTAPVPGLFRGLVHATGAAGQVFQNYQINVLASSNSYSLSGRVVANDGTPLSKGNVSLVGLNGSTFTVPLSPLGYFRFDGLPAGLTGTIEVGGKTSLTFPVQYVVISDVIQGIEVRANP